MPRPQSSHSGQRPRVLVVEDVSKLAGVIARGLREDSYLVDIASCGEDALAMASTTTYGGILLDVMLPGRSGFYVCRCLRARGISCPILMLTARDSPDDRASAHSAGADDYLAKPFSFDELLTRLRVLVDRASA